MRQLLRVTKLNLVQSWALRIHLEQEKSGEWTGHKMNGRALPKEHHEEVGYSSSSPPTPPIEETCYGEANIFRGVVVLLSVIRHRARCCGISADGIETRRMVELEKDWTGINAERRKWIEQRRARRNESEGQRQLE
ncbi:hypothetical protein CEXT_340311 [Caerostris extrusa]|uniref:Uncharacterized protein n=1 Tax=Caerostris extrusa TaxID=172846 RepID=A0AAV4S2R2_CAEEX|nr:hypothetical protein CEXT_340311 [Caerostris extrusa]